MEKQNTESRSTERNTEVMNAEIVNTENQNREKPLIRLLKASEIECRVGTVNEKGLCLLLYKDARVDQRILDETFTPFGWTRAHQSIDGNLYCTVSVYDDRTGMWISKQDVGSASFAEKEKSLASDSFKRACFNWGIGRELYSAPFIWISAGKVQIQERDGRYYCNERFSVQSISYNEEREITAFQIAAGNGRIVYEYRTSGSSSGADEGSSYEQQKGSRNSRNTAMNKNRDTAMDKNTDAAVRRNGNAALDKNRDSDNTTGFRANRKASLTDGQLRSFEEELHRTGVTMEQVEERFQVTNPEEMSAETYEKVMLALSRTVTAEAA